MPSTAAASLRPTAVVPATQVTFWAPPAVQPVIDLIGVVGVRRNPTTGLPESYKADGTAWDASQHKVTGGNTYYVSNVAANGYALGSDSNNGLSKSAPFLSFLAAYTAAPAGSTIYFNPSTSYNRSGYWTSTAVSKSLNFIGDGGVATFRMNDTLTWSLATGATNTYKATRSTVGWVWDSTTLDANGDNARLTKASSYAGTGELTNGQWYTDGTTVWVRPTVDRNMVGDTAIRVYLSSSPTITGNATVYVENVAWEGGALNLIVTNATGAGDAPTVFLKNCSAKYAGYYASGATADAIAVRGANLYAQGTVAAQASADGFGYHGYNGVACKSLEWDCTGRDNGWNGGDTNNGTTTHDASLAVVVGGEYLRNDGPNVVPAGDGTVCWCVGTKAADSTAGTTVFQNSNFQTPNGAATLYLDSCWGDYDPTTTGRYQFTTTATGSAIRFRNFTGGTRHYKVAGSTIRSY